VQRLHTQTLCLSLRKHRPTQDYESAVRCALFHGRNAFFWALLVVLGLVTYIPSISLGLGKLIG
jgi:hypothetical protein